MSEIFNHKNIDKNFEELYSDFEKKVTAPFSFAEKNKKDILEKISKLMHHFKAAYFDVKTKFQYVVRDDEKPYTSHVVWVLEIFMENFSGLEDNFEEKEFKTEEEVEKWLKLLEKEIDNYVAALYHDTIEDTDVTFEWLEESTCSENAFCVLLLSKEPIINFIEDKKEIKVIKKLKKRWILNKKGEKSDKLKKWKVKLNDEDKELLEKYEKIRKNYKKIRNKKYFEHFSSLENFREYAREIAKNNNMYFSEEKLETIIRRAILIKVCDRVHNLWNFEAWSKKRIRKKLEETKGLLNLAKEFDERAYKLLNGKIYEVEKNLEEEETKKRADKALKKPL